MKNNILDLLYQTGSDGKVQIDYDGLWNLYAKQREDIAVKQVNTYTQVVQKMEDESTEFETTFKLEEREQIGRLQKQMMVLFVIVTFIDKLQALISGCIYHTNIKQNADLKGSWVLANMLNNNILLFTDSIKPISQSDLVLFPRNLNIDDFLLQFPYVLEHIDYYVEFHPFDQFRVHKYLIDTFYTSTVRYDEKNQGGTIQERIQLGRCSPEDLLQERLTIDKEWVESVMTMIFIRYSGVMDVDLSFLYFSWEYRRILECFTFGGYLNREIKGGLYQFLKRRVSYEIVQKEQKEIYGSL